jgi:hypothetical protein
MESKPEQDGQAAEQMLTGIWLCPNCMRMVKVLPGQEQKITSMVCVCGVAMVPGTKEDFESQTVEYDIPFA